MLMLMIMSHDDIDDASDDDDIENDDDAKNIFLYIVNIVLIYIYKQQ